jgi:NADH-quinone oxidoreductase subunit G
MLAAAADGRLQALVVGGVELDDLPDPQAALAAIDAAPFVVSLEVRASQVSERADVVFPVAAAPRRQAPTSTGRGACVPSASCSRGPTSCPNLRVLAGIAESMPVPGSASARSRRCAPRWGEVGAWDGRAGRHARGRRRRAGDARDTGQVLLSSWRH